MYQHELNQIYSITTQFFSSTSAAGASAAGASAAGASAAALAAANLS